MPPVSTLRVRANLLLLACAAIWGFAFVAQRLGAHVGAFTFNSTRFLIGAVSLLPIIWVLDRRAGRGAGERLGAWRSVVVPGLICGGLLFGGSTLQQIGVETTTAGNAAFVTSLYVVMVPLLGIAFGHRTGLLTWAGVGLAVPGLYLLTVADTLASVNTGDVLCLIGTVFWTGHILAIGHFARRLDVLRLSVAQFVANSAYAAVAALLFEQAPFAGVPDALGPILYAGIMAVGVAYTLQVVGQRHARSSHAAMILSLEAMFGAIGGAVLLGETMGVRGLFGAGLMMAGIVLSQVPAPGTPEGDLAPVPEPPSTALRAD